jgi:hypothetical protein
MENAMQGGDDLLRKNLEAFGERDGEKRRTAISTIWSLTEYSSILTVRGPEAIDNAVEGLC